MQLLTNSLLMGFGTAVASQLTQRIGCYRQPHPMPHQFAQMLDHPWRLRYRDPVETVGNLGLSAGMTLLDLGCGTGTYTVEMAQAVGVAGTVHAVDLQQHLLQQAQARVRQANVEAQCTFITAAPINCPSRRTPLI
ncbi:MAG: methyltransferase domain-containing protein [Caldilineaceae bacterium]